MPVVKNKCRCCTGEYDTGVDGKFCSNSCKQIHYQHYITELNEAYKKISDKYYGG